MKAIPLPQTAAAAESDPRPPGFWARFVWFAPAVAVLLAVTLYPTAVVLWLSVHRTRLYEVVHGVGLANYISVISSPAFLELSRNSLLYVFGALAVVLPMGLASALALQNIARGAMLARTLLLLPWTLSMGVVGCFWLWLLNPSYGPMSYLMRSLGIEPGLMLGEPSLALLLVILVTAWWSFPYVMVMMSAALQSVPAELYEAIEMDGGGLRERLRHAVWPHIAPTLGSTALALSILYLTLITLILVLTGGGPLGETATWSYEVFASAFRSVDLSPSSVISIVVLLVNLLLGYLYTRFTGRVTG
jgi:multiple sugar transport system permease protein